MPVKIRIVLDNNVLRHGNALELPYQTGQTIAQCVYLSGQLASPALCSGLGRCGLCRVRFVKNAPVANAADTEVLGEELVRAGWRLGCRHMAANGQELELPDGIEFAVRAENTGAAAIDPQLGLAVDLGTTSIYWRFVRRSASASEPGKVLCEGRLLNPQMGAGSEVVSRLAEAVRPQGLARLAELVQGALRDIISQFANEYGVLPARFCVAGNPVMTSLFLNLSPEGLGRAPYSLPLQGGIEYHLSRLPPVYIPPLLAPFVGADISAGIVALNQGAFGVPSAWPFIFADLGTNCEFVLGLNPERYLILSIPMGPAIEGIGLACGRLAGVGGGPKVITGFRLNPGCSAGLEGNVPLAEAQGISGTGYLSLLAILLANRVVLEDGRFADVPPQNPLARKLYALIQTQGAEPRLVLGQLSLSAGDIEELLKVKAAFSLAFKALLAGGGLAPGGLGAVYLAGALGTYVNPADLQQLGFLPAGLASKVIPLGNAALAGAELLLFDDAARARAAEFKAASQLLSLVGRPGFMTEYLENMRFSY